MDDAKLLTMQEAAATLHRNLPASALHRARRNGLLKSYKIGHRYYTTMEAIEEFVECQGIESQPGCTSERMKSNGSSAMEKHSCGHALATASVERLKKRLQATSPTDDHQPGAVLPIRAK